MAVKNYYRYVKAFFRQEFRSIREYRFNFISQTFGMMINDLFWIIFWAVFFYRFNTINGWGFKEMMMIQAIVFTSFGLSIGLFSNARRLSKIIEDGGLDYFLILPKNILLQSIMKVRYSAIGDLFMGIIMAIIFIPAKSFPIFIIGTLLSSTIFISWGVIVGSLAFFFGRFEQAARAANEALIMVAVNPFSTYQGWIKLFLLFVLPAGLIGAVPLYLIQEFSIKWLLALIISAIVFFAIALAIFYLGLRRYESGNVISMKD